MDDGGSAARYDVGGSYDYFATGSAPRAVSAGGRPTTAGTSRLGTAGTRPRTDATGANVCYVVAIIENRAREVGVAAVDVMAMHKIELHQIADNQSYSQTKALLCQLCPTAIVFSHSQTERPIVQLLRDALNEAFIDPVEISGINRKFFDDVKGREYMQKLSAGDMGEAEGADKGGRYLAVAACSALIRYCEFVQRMTFENNAVQFVWRADRKHMSIDYETVKNLELLAGARSGSPKDR